MQSKASDLWIQVHEETDSYSSFIKNNQFVILFVMLLPCPFMAYVLY